MITDFGLCSEGGSKVARTTVYSRGTASYRAPELLSAKPLYSNRVDIWALGCILYELAFDRKAFHDDWNVREYREPAAIDLLQSYVTKWAPWVVAGLRRTLLSVWIVDWGKRPTAKGIQDIAWDNLMEPPGRSSLEYRNYGEERKKLRREVGRGNMRLGRLLGDTKLTKHTLEYIIATGRLEP